MKRKLPLLITLLLSSLLFAEVVAQDASKDAAYSKLGIKAGYFGEFVMHPGFAAGIDYSLHQNQWFTFHWDTEIGSYFHKWNNNALFAQSTLGTRFTTSFSAFFDLNAGIGYMLATPSGDVYQVGSDGNLTLSGKPFTGHLKPNVSFLFGWDGSRKRDIPLMIHTGLEAYWQSKFNHSMLPHAAWRFGIVYKLKK